ncbi:MAG: transposase [Chitinophagaceae bacterium]|nr:transposase [Chitinophagaceae bacterium]
MSKYKKQSHVVCKCDYHIVWVPKYRFRILTGEVGRLMATDIRMYSEWLGCEIIKLNPFIGWLEWRQEIFKI